MNRWYEAHLIGDKLNTYGATLYGLPFIVIGFNEHIAWTFTKNSVDLADIFAEKLNSNNIREYLTEDGWRNIVEKGIGIKVRIGERYKTISKTVYYTGHGPIIFYDKGKRIAYSMSLEGLDVLPVLDTFYHINIAGNLSEFIDALKLNDFKV